MKTYYENKIQNSETKRDSIYKPIYAHFFVYMLIIKYSKIITNNSNRNEIKLYKNNHQNNVTEYSHFISQSVRFHRFLHDSDD
jgi:hypothetical protein